MSERHLRNQRILFILWVLTMICCLISVAAAVTAHREGNDLRASLKIYQQILHERNIPLPPSSESPPHDPGT